MTNPAAAPRPLEASLRLGIRDVPDYPKPGIIFKDITPLLGNASMFADACEGMTRPFAGERVSHVASIESRGFLFGGPIAKALGAGVVPVRKKGKLPSRAEREEYALEYGVDSLEMHSDALPSGSRVLVVDDVLATGGTAAAACRLIERLGGTVVGCSFLIRLSFLDGGAKLDSRRVEALLVY